MHELKEQVLFARHDQWIPTPTGNVATRIVTCTLEGRWLGEAQTHFVEALYWILTFVLK